MDTSNRPRLDAGTFSGFYRRCSALAKRLVQEFCVWLALDPTPLRQEAPNPKVWCLPRTSDVVPFWVVYVSTPYQQTIAIPKNYIGALG